MTLEDVQRYWEEFLQQGEKENWDVETYDEYQFGTFLISKSQYT